MEKCNNRIITLSGDPGSGKGSVAKQLKELYQEQGIKVRIFSMGDLFREIAVQEYKKRFPEVQVPSLEEIQSNPDFAKELREIDENMDNKITQLINWINSKPRPEEIFFLDSRMAWFDSKRASWSNHQGSFDVRLTVDSKTAGERVFKDQKRGAEDRYSSLEEAIQDTASRREKEIERYKEQYGADLTDPDNFDLIIGTTLARIEDIARTIQICEELKREGKPFAKTWASPELFYPTQSCEQTEYEYVWMIKDDKERRNYLGYPFATTWELQRLYPDQQIDHHTTQVDKWVRGKHTVEELAHLIQESGIDPNEPITATSIGNSTYNFVEDGHHRVFGSILAGKTLVPYKIIGHREKEEVGERELHYIIGHQFCRLDGTQFSYAKLPPLEKEKSKIQDFPNQDDEQGQETK